MSINRGEAGVHNVEGAVGGARAVALAKEREEQAAAFEAAKNDLQSSSRILPKNIGDKFKKSRTDETKKVDNNHYGLATLDQYRRAKAGEITQEKDDKQDDDIIAKTEARAVESRKRAAKKRKANSSFLSFGGSDDDSSSSDDDTNEKDDAGSSSSSNTSSNTTHKTTKTNTNTNKRSKIMKCSDVDTSFLPDRDRRVQDESLRTKLKKEYEERQRQLKQQKLEITYSWWDGSGHRRTIQVPQGTSIGEFLELVRINICEQFPELKKMSSDNMMYIKEDLIIPGDYTFYDLIKTKARGKSGPLFCFDVHDDLRMGPIDSRVEKDESHPGKIVDRSWYERNKHIFPANRWEIYDPSIDYGGYTIHGGEVN